MYENIKHHINDKILKLAANSLEMILNESGIEGKILETLPTEYLYKFNEYRMDYLCKMDDGKTRNLEFQKNKPIKDDFIRFIAYNCLLFIKKESNSELIMIALYPTESKEIKIEITKSVTLTIKIICLKHINGDDKLKSITEKINNKIPLTKRDIDYIKLLPLLETTKPSEEVLVDLIHLTNKLEISLDELSEIKALQHLYAAKFIEDKFEREMLIEVINMKVGLVDDAINLGIKKGIEKGEKRGIKKGEKRGIKKGEKRGIKKGEKRGIKKGIKKGIEKGIEKGKIEIIQSMLLNGISPESIAESTNIDLEFIESVHLSK